MGRVSPVTGGSEPVMTKALNGPGLVPPYTGQSQPSKIQVPAKIFYRMVWEEGAWVMKAYSEIYPEILSEQNPPQYTDPVVPPPISKTDLWSAMQTWPL